MSEEQNFYPNSLTGSVKDKIGVFEDIEARRQTLFLSSDDTFKNKTHNRRQSYTTKEKIKANKVKIKEFRNSLFFSSPHDLENHSHNLRALKSENVFKTELVKPIKKMTISKIPQLCKETIHVIISSSEFKVSSDGTPSIKTPSDTKSASEALEKKEIKKTATEKDLKDLIDRKETVEKQLEKFSCPEYLSEEFKIFELSSYQMDKIKRMMTEYKYIKQIEEYLNYQQAKTSRESLSSQDSFSENNENKIFSINNQINIIKAEKSSFELKKTKILSYVTNPDDKFTYEKAIEQNITEIEYLSKEYSRLVKDMYICKRLTGFTS